MPNKMNKKASFKIKNVIRTGLATILASTIGITSGVAFTTLNNGQGASAYLRDGVCAETTRIMMDKDSYLINDYWMKVVLTDHPGASWPMTYDVKLFFIIPGYDLKNLTFVIKDRNSGDMGEYHISEGSSAVELSNWPQSVYDVSVYEGDSSSGKFICKADFYLADKDGHNAAVPNTTEVLDASGNPITNAKGEKQMLTYRNPVDGSANNLIKFELPYDLVPYNTHTIKAVFFAAEPYRKDKAVNISRSLYDYSWCQQQYNGADDVHFFYTRKMTDFGKGKTGADSDVTYEVHFYKDNVKKENFLFKAVGFKIGEN